MKKPNEEKMIIILNGLIKQPAIKCLTFPQYFYS